MTDQITELLTTFKTSVRGVESAAVTSLEGRTICSTLVEPGAKLKLASLSAASLAIGKKSVADLNLGGLDQIYITGLNRSLLLTAVGTKALMSVVITDGSDMDSITREVKRVTARILLII